MTGENKKALGNATSKGEAMASSEDLAIALSESQKTIKMLEEKLAKAESNNSDDGISKLADALEKLVAKKEPEIRGISDIDNINRTNDFKAQKAIVDGRNLMEAQQIAQEFRKEQKFPIAIPRAMADFFGQTLTVTVNGARVSIPCDGKTYYINKTHWEHAKERIARVDALNTNNELTNIVMEA